MFLEYVFTTKMSWFHRNLKVWIDAIADELVELF